MRSASESSSTLYRLTVRISKYVTLNVRTYSIARLKFLDSLLLGWLRRSQSLYSLCTKEYTPMSE